MEDVAQKHCGVESTQKYCEAHELTLSGHPWNVDSGEEAIKTRILIGNLIMTFKSKGKVIHPKYYKYLKKGAHPKPFRADKKLAGFWQISLYIK